MVETVKKVARRPRVFVRVGGGGLEEMVETDRKVARRPGPHPRPRSGVAAGLSFRFHKTS